MNRVSRVFNKDCTKKAHKISGLMCTSPLSISPTMELYDDHSSMCMVAAILCKQTKRDELRSLYSLVATVTYSSDMPDDGMCRDFGF